MGKAKIFDMSETKDCNLGSVMLRYMCANCGNKCLESEKPDNSICGGCTKPNWKLMKKQQSYKVGEGDYTHPQGEI